MKTVLVGTNTAVRPCKNASVSSVSASGGDRYRGRCRVGVPGFSPDSGRGVALLLAGDVARDAVADVLRGDVGERGHALLVVLEVGRERLGIPFE